MSGFQFPPPPPPPPKASSTSDTSQHGQYFRQDRVHGRGRGRGSDNFRGRSDRGSYSNHQRGGQYANGRPQSQSFNQAALSLASYDNRGKGSSMNDASFNIGEFATNGPPPGSYINPLFMTHAPGSLPGSNNSVNGTRNTPPTLSRTAAGHKRKLEALRGPSQHQKKLAPSTVPSTPSFGASILSNTQTADVALPQRIPKDPTPKRTSNLFGLTHDEDHQYTSSDSDEENDGPIDEESMFAELGTALTFEHNGVVVSLNSSADLARWKDERRRNWPTKHRMAAKWEAKRNLGLRRKTLIADAIFKLSSPKPTRSISKTLPNEEAARRGQSSLTTMQVEDLAPASIGKGLQTPNPEISANRALHNVETPLTKSTDVATESGDTRNFDGVDHEASLRMSSPHPLDEHVESATGSESDDDGPPEEHASKLSSSSPHQIAQICRYFKASGRCRDGESCRFRHEISSQAPDPSLTKPGRQPKQQPNKQHAVTHAHENLGSARPTIFGLLTAKEENDKNLLALQVIKQLGDIGLFDEAQ